VNNEQTQPPFVPGLILAESFFQEQVQPILKSRYPELSYSAALIGSGSEVMEFDTEMSRDHHWGPRVMLFLRADDFKSKRDEIKKTLSRELPKVYLGYPTNFSEPNPEDNNVQLLQPGTSGLVNHRVEIYTLTDYFLGYLNLDVNNNFDVADWLTFPQQKLRSITAGRVFRDDLGLEATRARFAWYPHDVWLYILASTWNRVGQEEHIMGRAGYVGDEAGSSIIGSRLVRDIMRLAFLMEKEYPPYAKWLGTAFHKLKSASKFGNVFEEVLHATSWQERETSLCRAYETLAEIHNSLGITSPVSSKTSLFWSRPFKVIKGEKFAQAIIKEIKDPQVVPLTKHSLIGNIDLISDNTDFLEDQFLRLALKALYT
jgi:hypothetical protein